MLKFKNRVMWVGCPEIQRNPLIKMNFNESEVKKMTFIFFEYKMTKVPTDFFYDIADKLFSLVSNRKITTNRHTFQVRTTCLPQDVSIVLSFLNIQKLLLKYTFIEHLFALIKRWYLIRPTFTISVCHLNLLL